MRCDELPVALNVHFRVGMRAELDRRFRQALEAKPDGQNMSDFVKLAVAEWYESKLQRQKEMSEAEKVRQELGAKIRRLDELIRSGVVEVKTEIAVANANEENSKIDEVKIREAEMKVQALTDAF